MMDLSSRLSAKAHRFAILIRDGWQCAYCASELTVETATLDHIRPASFYGTRSATNLVASCRSCNESRGNRVLDRRTYRILRQRAKVPLDWDAARTLARFFYRVQSL